MLTTQAPHVQIDQSEIARFSVFPKIKDQVRTCSVWTASWFYGIKKPMFRKDLIPMLLEHPMTVTEISRFAEQPGKDTAEDLRHLIKSLKHTEYDPVIDAATCKKCGFEFSADKLRKPSKCPKCKSTWVTEPRVSVKRR